MSNELEKLAEKRDAILLAEIGAWLHMLGKYSWDFIEEYCGNKHGYNYQNFFSPTFSKDYPDLFSLFDSLAPKVLKTLLNLTPQIAIPSTPSNIFNFKSFVADHAPASKDKLTEIIDRDDQLTILMNEGHGRSSSTEKGILYKQLNLQQQQLPNIYLNTAFGFNRKFLTSNDYEKEKLRKRLNEIIGKIVSNLPKKDTHSWNEWMREFKSILYMYFHCVLAETRKPTNDITLMDQTSVAVSFFKAALAGRVAKVWEHSLTKENHQYSWRILTVRSDTFDYFSKTAKLPDLLGRKKNIEQAQARIHELIEVEYPFGSEIYRDQSIIAFLVPGEGDILKWADGNNEILEKKIKRIYQNETDGEIAIQLQDALMEDPSRSVYTFGNMLSAAPPRNIPDIQTAEQHWQGKPQVQICTNCRLRPQGSSPKAKSRNICDICLHKRISRSKDWCTSHLETTVWLDEVADNNGRLALLACQFDLRHWLNGLLWNSVRSILHQSYNGLFENASKSIGKTSKGNYRKFEKLLMKLITYDIRQQYSDYFEPFFNEVIWPDWEDIVTRDDQQIKADITATHLLRQQPSFARIRRAWNTTQQFFHDIRRKIEQGGLIPRVPNRLILKGKLMTTDIGKYHSYNTRIKGIETSFIWDAEKERFISGDNLHYLAKQIGYKPAKDVSLEEDVPNIIKYLIRHFGEQSKERGLGFYERKTPSLPEDEEHRFWLEDVRIEPERHEYTPTVSILTEPQLFMVLTPADKLMNVAQHILKEYEEQFSKVRNRLPLHVSLVYFHRRVPLYTAMNATQRMLKRKSEENPIWIVTEIHADSTQHVTKLCLKKSDNSAVTPKIFINHTFGNDADYHYPYFFIEGVEPDERPPYSFKAPLPHSPDIFKTLVHVSELQEGDEVYYMPSTFDFEFLDTTGRRFEIQYDEKGQRVKGKANRPYLLEQIAEFQDIWDLLSGKKGKGLTSTQLNALEKLIEERRRVWNCEPNNTTFQQFVTDSLRNIDAGWWKSLDAEKQKLMHQAAQSGMLADVLEVYMEIMKQKSK